MRVWAIIPARMASTRLPGKVLAEIHGAPMVQHVWQRVVASSLFERVGIATDDRAIAERARGFGAEVIVTGPAANGTARVAAAVGDAPVAVVNVQADQPLVSRDDLAAVVRQLARGAAIATLCAPLQGDPEDPARVKVQVGEAGRAVTFSRRPIAAPHLVHVGIYGFAPGAVSACAAAPASARSRAEDLEQLAWMDAGLAIDVQEVNWVTPSVDTPADLARVRSEWPGEG